MIRLFFRITLFCFILTSVLSSYSLADDQGMLLPESLAARSQMAADTKTVTIFIETDEPEEVIKLLNSSNGEYAKKGWKLFSIIPFTDGGDFEGCFVTYQKKLITME